MLTFIYTHILTGVVTCPNQQSSTQKESLYMPPKYTTRKLLMLRNTDREKTKNTKHQKVGW
jgi:hypothetical protein